MNKETDKQWNHHISQAKQNLLAEQTRIQQSPVFNWKLNTCLFIIPLATLALALFWLQQCELLAFAIWFIGGLCAFGVLIIYATSNKVSPAVKEAALSFLLGNLIVFGLFLLNPV